MSERVPFIVLSSLLSKSEHLIEEITVFDLAIKCLPEDDTEQPSVEYIYTQIENLLEKLNPKMKAEVALAFMINGLIDLNEAIAGEIREEEQTADEHHSMGNA